MKNYLNSHQRTIQGSFLILRDALQLRMNYRNQTIADVFSNAIEQQLKKLRIDHEPSYEKTLLVSYFPQFVFRFSRSRFPSLIENSAHFVQRCIQLGSRFLFL